MHCLCKKYLTKYEFSTQKFNNKEEDQTKKLRPHSLARAV